MKNHGVLKCPNCGTQLEKKISKDDKPVAQSSWVCHGCSQIWFIVKCRKFK